MPILTNHFVNRFSERDIHIEPDTMKMLEGYSWPGNVRQLENVIQRALILCDLNRLLPEHIILEEDSNDANFTGTLREFEKILLLKRLNMYDGNRTVTAKSLGVSVRWVQLKLKEMNANK